MSALKICMWNANGVHKHQSEIGNYLSAEDIDIMLLSETHLTNKYNFYIPGFTFYKTNHPDGKAHGGTGILIKSRIRHFALEEYSKNYLQATSLSVVFHGSNITLSAIYCPPRFSITSAQFSDFFATLGEKFLAAGDYNAKHTYWGSRLITPRGRQLYNVLMNKRDLDFVSPGQPTYWPTDLSKKPDLIDFGITKHISRNLITAESSPDLSSDHSPVIFNLTENPVYNHQDYKLTSPRTNWLKYRKYISSHIHIGSSDEREEDIDFKLHMFNSLLATAAEVATPAYCRAKNDSVKISNSQIEELVNTKRRLRREWQSHRSPAAKSRLNLATKKLREALRNIETCNLDSYLENLSPNCSKQNSLWKATKSFKPPIDGDSPLRLPNGNWARSDQEKAELFAKHLSSVFEPNPSTNDFRIPLLDEINYASDCALSFTPDELSCTIQNELSIKKAPGCDLISPKMIKELPMIAVVSLTTLFNTILQKNYFPSSWKTSQIIMIHKPGKDKAVPSSYRPISLLPCLSKLFEKLLLAKIMPHLNDNCLIPGHQFGFRREHGTIEQVNRITDRIRRTFEDRDYCSAIFLDVAQAFDKVWHEGLLYKIRNLFPLNCHKILESYLYKRTFRVKYKSHTTDDYEIKAGVPQGSVLGPILYIVFTSDLPTDQRLMTSTFADDTAILSTNKNPTLASMVLNEHLRMVETWLSNWRIKVNEQKCKHVTFSLRPDTCPPVSLNNIVIQQSNDVAYLGIHLDRRLTWRRHIEAKKTQINIKSSSLHWLINYRSRLSLEYKVLLYNTMIKPIWTYGVQLWGNASRTNIDVIQRSQSKILRTITGAPWYIRNENIHKDLDIPFIKDEITRLQINYKTRLEHHPNPLARNLVNTASLTRLRRNDLPTVHQDPAE